MRDNIAVQSSIRIFGIGSNLNDRRSPALIQRHPNQEVIVVERQLCVALLWRTKDVKIASEPGSTKRRCNTNRQLIQFTKFGKNTKINALRLTQPPVGRAECREEGCQEM